MTTRSMATIPVTPGGDLVDRFLKMRSAVFDAASPFVKRKMDVFPMNPDYFYYLDGADEDISRVLKGRPSGTSLGINVLPDGSPVYVVRVPA